MAAAVASPPSAPSLVKRKLLSDRSKIQTNDVPTVYRTTPDATKTNGSPQTRTLYMKNRVMIVNKSGKIQMPNRAWHAGTSASKLMPGITPWDRSSASWMSCSRTPVIWSIKQMLSISTKYPNAPKNAPKTNPTSMARPMYLFFCAALNSRYMLASSATISIMAKKTGG